MDKTGCQNSTSKCVILRMKRKLEGYLKRSAVSPKSSELSLCQSFFSWCNKNTIKKQFRLQCVYFSSQCRVRVYHTEQVSGQMLRKPVTLSMSSNPAIQLWFLIPIPVKNGSSCTNNTIKIPSRTWWEGTFAEDTINVCQNHRWNYVGMDM